MTLEGITGNKHRDIPRDKILSYRATTEGYNAVKALAKIKGMSISDFLRVSVYAEFVRASNELAKDSQRTP